MSLHRYIPLIIGRILLLFPDKVRQITKSRKYRNADGPTTACRITIRIPGVLFTVTGLLLLCGILE